MESLPDVRGEMPFFELSSDFMAIGPVGSPYWTAINPALAVRLGLNQKHDVARSRFVDPDDRGRVLTHDGSPLLVDWTIREEGDVSYWIGRERSASVVRELHHRLKNNLQFIV